MIEAALMIIAQKPYLEQRIGSLFCAQSDTSAREHCLRFWRRPSGCGCG